MIDTEYSGALVSRSSRSCADPEIFMRGGPTKMVIFGHRRGGSDPQKSRNYHFFWVKFSNSRGGGVRTPGPPSGSAHVDGAFRKDTNHSFWKIVYGQ